MNFERENNLNIDVDFFVCTKTGLVALSVGLNFLAFGSHLTAGHKNQHILKLYQDYSVASFT